MARDNIDIGLKIITTQAKTDLTKTLNELQAFIDKKPLTIDVVGSSQAASNIAKIKNEVVSLQQAIQSLNSTSKNSKSYKNLNTESIRANSNIDSMVDTKSAQSARKSAIRQLQVQNQAYEQAYQQYYIKHNRELAKIQQTYGGQSPEALSAKNRLAQIQAQHNAVKQANEKLVGEIKKYDNFSLATGSKELSRFKNFDKSINKPFDYIANKMTYNPATLAIQQGKLSQKIQQYMNTFRGGLSAGGMYGEFDVLKHTVAQGNFQNIKDVSQQFELLKLRAREAGLEAETTMSKFGQGVGSHIRNFVSQLMILGTVGSLGKMYMEVVKIDTAMTELKKVTSATSDEYKKFTADAGVRAKKVGAKISETINASADFARLGYNLKDSANLADAALIYKGVGDDIKDVDQATKSIISTMQGFRLPAEQAMSIVDKFNAVSNKKATSAGDIGEGIKRSAAALYAAGNTLDESIGLFTAAQTINQDADVVGTALKTMTMRMRASQTVLQQQGVDTEGMASSVSKLRQELKELTGVDIMKSSKEFKSTYEMLKEMSGVWNTLSDVTKANVLELLAGKRQGNIIAGILEDFSIAESSKEIALNSAGSANEENYKRLNSIQGKTIQLFSTFEQIAQNTFDTDVIKGFIGGLTTILELISKITSVGGGLGTILGGIAGYRAITNPEGMFSGYGIKKIVDSEGDTQLMTNGKFIATTETRGIIAKAKAQAMALNKIYDIDTTAVLNDLKPAVKSFTNAQGKFIKNNFNHARNYLNNYMNQKYNLQGILQSAKGTNVEKQLLSRYNISNKDGNGLNRLIQGIYKQTILDINNIDIPDTQKMRKMNLFISELSGLANSFGIQIDKADKAVEQIILRNKKANIKTKDFRSQLKVAIGNRDAYVSGNQPRLKQSVTISPKQQVPNLNDSLASNVIINERVQKRAYGQRIRDKFTPSDNTISGFKSIGKNIFSAFSGILNGFLIGGIIDFVSTWLGSKISKQGWTRNSRKENKDDIINTYDSKITEITQKRNDLKSLSKEFSSLSRGVDAQGKNIGLSADEFSRYNDIVNQLIAINPELVKGFDSAGNAIVDQSKAISSANKILDKQREDAVRALLENDNRSKIFDSEKDDFNDEVKDIKSKYNLKGRKLEAYNHNFVRNGMSIDDMKAIEKEADDENTQLLSAINKDKGLRNRLLSNMSQTIKSYMVALSAKEDIGGFGLNIQDSVLSDNLFNNAIKQTILRNSLLKSNRSTIDYEVKSVAQNMQALMKGSRSYTEKTKDGSGVKEFHSFVTSQNKSLFELLQTANNAKRVLDNSLWDTKDVKAYNDAMQEVGTGFDDLIAKAYALGDKDIALALTIEKDALVNFTKELSLEDAFNIEAVGLSAARGQLEAFKETSKEDYYTAIKGYNEILSVVKEADNLAGKGSLTFWNGAERILGKKAINDADYDIDRVYALIRKMEGRNLFAHGEEGARAFVQLLQESVDKINQISDNGEKLIDGNSLNIDPSQYQKVADVLGISRDMLVSMLDNARQFTNIDFSNTGKLIQGIRQDKSFIDTGGGSGYISEQTIIQAGRSQGLTLKEVQDNIKKIKEAEPKIKIYDLDNAKDTLNTALKVNEIAYKNKEQKVLSAEGVITNLVGMGATSDQIKDVIREAISQGFTVADGKGNQIKKDTDLTKLESNARANIDNVQNAETNPVVKATNETNALISKSNALLEQIALQNGSDVTNENVSDLKNAENTIQKYIDGGLTNDQKVAYETHITDTIQKQQSELDRLLALKDSDAYKNGTNEYRQGLDSSIRNLEQTLDRVSDKWSKVNKAENKAIGSVGAAAANAIMGASQPFTPSELAAKLVAKFEIDGNANVFYDIINNVPNGKEILIKAAEDTGNAATIAKVKSSIDSLRDKHIRITASVDAITSGVQGVVNSVVRRIMGSARGTMGRRRPNTATFGSAANGFNWQSVPRRSSKNKGGKTLVGELGAELVWSGDHAYLVGKYSPEIVDLKKGDIVYPADETKKILRGQSIHKPIQSMAFGSFDFVSRSTYGNIKSKAQNRTSGKSASGDQSDAIKTQLNLYDEELKYLNHRLQMGYITERDYYNQLTALYNKHLKNRKGIDDEIRKSLEAQKKAWIDAYNWQKRLLDVQLNLDIIDPTYYLQHLKKLGDEYYQGKPEFASELYKHLEDLQKAQLAAYKDKHDKLAEQLQDELVTIEDYYKKAKQLENQFLKDRYMTDDREKALKEVNSNIAKAINDLISNAQEKISDKDLFSAWQKGESPTKIWIELKDAVINYYNQGMLKAKEYSEIVQKLNREIQKSQKDTYKKDKQSLDAVTDLVEKLVRQEAKDLIDALQKQEEKYNQLISKKKESLQLAEQELQFQEEIADIAKDIAKKQFEVDMLAKDDSRAGKAKYAQASEELNELIKKQRVSIATETNNKTNEMLDKQLEVYNQLVKTQVDKINEFLEHQKKVLEQVYQEISLKETNNLLTRLVEYNEKHGDGFKDTAEDFWNDLKDILEKYNNNIVDVIKFLKIETKDKETGGVVPVVKKHTGLKTGFVGDSSTIKQNERLALLTRDELVLSLADQKRLANSIGVAESLYNNVKKLTTPALPLGSVVNNATNIELRVEAPVTVNGGTTEDMLKQISKVGDEISHQTLSKLTNALNIKGVSVNPAINVFKR